MRPLSQSAVRRLQIKVLLLEQMIQEALQGRDLEIATDQWAKDTGVSRQATRTVLKHLADEDVVPIETAPGRGTKVRLFSAISTRDEVTEETTESTNVSTKVVETETTVKTAPSGRERRGIVSETTRESTEVPSIDLRFIKTSSSKKESSVEISSGRSDLPNQFIDGPPGGKIQLKVAAGIKYELYDFFGPDLTEENHKWLLKTCWLFATVYHRREAITDILDRMRQAGEKIKNAIAYLRRCLCELAKKSGDDFNQQLRQIELKPWFFQQERDALERKAVAA